MDPVDFPGDTDLLEAVRHFAVAALFQVEDFKAEAVSNLVVAIPVPRTKLLLRNNITTKVLRAERLHHVLKGCRRPIISI